MSMMSNGPPSQGTAGVTDLVVAVQGVVKHLSSLVMATKTQATYGSFTLAAAATTTVLQPAVTATSFINLTPTNASAATLEGSAKKLYISSISPGVSFTVATGNGVSAAGTETFSYSVSPT
jgi:hypothetical protein